MKMVHFVGFAVGALLAGLGTIIANFAGIQEGRSKQSEEDKAVMETQAQTIKSLTEKKESK